jgi:OmpA-OmpF porin, OOP family
MMLVPMLLGGVLACQPSATATASPSAKSAPGEAERPLEPPEQAPLAPEPEPDAATEHLVQLDSDQDGFPDSVDACPTIPEDYDGEEDDDGCFDEAIYRVDPCAVRLDGKIEFTNSTEIDPGSHALLDDLVELLKNDPDITIQVSGHTDSNGSDSANLQLSDQRANRVRDWLIERGIAAERITAKGYGEAVPVDTNRTAEGRANNRRVEIQRTDKPEC